jgi:hypothetical protein
VLIITHLKLLFTHCSSLPVCLEKGQVKNKAIHLTSEERNQLWCRCKERISRHSRLTNSRSFANVNSRSLSVSSSGKSGTTSPAHQNGHTMYISVHKMTQVTCTHSAELKNIGRKFQTWSLHDHHDHTPVLIYS